MNPEELESALVDALDQIQRMKGQIEQLQAEVRAARAEIIALKAKQPKLSISYE